MKNVVIQNDIMRYKKNKLSGNLTLLGLLFNCLYFMVMYAQIAGNARTKFDGGEPVYSILTGISVMLNLVLLLAMFLSSEELKGYNKKFSIVVWVLAGLQIIRIFGYPMTTYNTPLSGDKYIFDEGVLVILIAFLVASAACLVASGVIGLLRANRLEKFRKDVDEGKIDLEAALAEEEAEAQVTSTVETSEVE